VVELLQNISPSDLGNIQLGMSSSVGKIVRRITIMRGKFTGPCFSIRAGGSFSDPMIDIVEQKFGKEYPTANPVELMAYYELQPPPFDWVWQQLDDFTKRNLATSPFRRVWVYNHATKRVKYVYPPIKRRSSDG